MPTSGRPSAYDRSPASCCASSMARPRCVGLGRGTSGPRSPGDLRRLAQAATRLRRTVPSPHGRPLPGRERAKGRGRRPAITAPSPALERTGGHRRGLVHGVERSVATCVGGNHRASASVWSPPCSGSASSTVRSTHCSGRYSRSRRTDALSLLHPTEHWPGRIVVELVALRASSVVTAATHAGYPELRGATLVQPMFGTTGISLGCLLSMDPLAPLMRQIAMPVASVLYGMGKTLQLPSHYSVRMAARYKRSRKVRNPS